MGTLDSLTRYLKESDKDQIILSFNEIEDIINRPLMRSSRYPAFWSNSDKNGYSYAWKRAGYKTTLRGLAPGFVSFVRQVGIASSNNRPPIQHPNARDSNISSQDPRVCAILIGCVKTKANAPQPAKDLYISPLFIGRRAYAEASGKPWLILSSRYGLVDPDEIIPPYELIIKSMSATAREVWGWDVVRKLEERFGSLRGKVFEVHAGADYTNALERPILAEGAQLIRPLRNLRYGEQLQWYNRASSQVHKQHSRSEINGKTIRPPIVQDGGRGMAWRITKAFMSEELDLSQRTGAPAPGWAGMPECCSVGELRSRGASDSEVRLFLTFISALDRAREADQLWYAGRDLFIKEQWVYDPKEVITRSFTELMNVLRSHNVSQRHLVDTAAWRVIAETLSDPKNSKTVHDAVFNGRGDVVELLASLQERGPRGTPRFPMLKGPKIGPMLIRMLVYPGGASLSSLDELTVAVDVQVRKISEFLGVTDTYGQKLENVRGIIQKTWMRDVKEHGADGPEPLKGMSAALDPALWFYAKWGCTYCANVRRRMPIAEPCNDCRLEELIGDRRAPENVEEDNNAGPRNETTSTRAGPVEPPKSMEMEKPHDNAVPDRMIDGPTADEMVPTHRKPSWKEINRRITVVKKLPSSEERIRALEDLFRIKEDGMVSYNLAKEYESIGHYSRAKEFFKKTIAYFEPFIRNPRNDMEKRISTDMVRHSQNGINRILKIEEK